MVDKMAFNIIATISFLLALFSPAISIENNHHGSTIQLIPIDTIDSHLFPKNLSLKERNQRIIEMSYARANLYSSYNNLSMVQPFITPALGSTYVTKVMIGGFVYSPHLVVDTGSDFVWVQGEGCTKCFQIQQGNFNYSASWTFRRLSCHHPLCAPKICDANDFCLYDKKFRFGCSSKGIMGTDEFTFVARDASHQTFNLTFGVGLENEGNLFGANMGPNNTIGGVLGIGMGLRSTLSQLRSFTKERMSYCLKPTYAHDRMSALSFGDHAQISHTTLGRVQATPFMRGPNKYFLYLTGISIEGTLVPIDQSLFQLRQDRSGGFIIDSGLGPTLLIESAYGIFKHAMILYFRRFSMNPSTRAVHGHDLCYMKPYPANISFPRMTYHFQGANLVLDPRATFTHYGEGFCMMVLPFPDYGPSALGAFQQANHRFRFDKGAAMLSFVPETC